MIFDDERDVNDILASLIRAYGFDSIQIFELDHILNIIIKYSPVIILLDVMMPGDDVITDGFIACERLKRDRATNLIPIIMVTALQAAKDRARGVRVGANGYLAKPFTPRQLLESIEQAIAWRREHETRGTEGEINFDVRNELTYLQQVNDLLADLFAHTPMTERQVKDLKQAVMEMGGNAIEWGHRKNADLVLRITYRIDANSVTLVIQDHGPGFNRIKLPHAASDEDPIGHLDIHNELGIMLAKGLLDDFRYNDKGNEVTLVKRFDRK